MILEEVYLGGRRVRGFGLGDYHDEKAYKDALGVVQRQLAAEGQDPSLAQVSFDAAVNQLVTTQGMQLDASLYQAAGAYTLAVHSAATALGALKTLVASFSDPNFKPGAAVQATMTVLISVGAAAGVVSGPVGIAATALVAVVAILSDQLAMNVFPPGPTICGVEMPNWVRCVAGRCLGTNACDPDKRVADPTSPYWMKFPAKDSVWYQKGYAYYNLLKVQSRPNVDRWFNSLSKYDSPIENAFPNDWADLLDLENNHTTPDGWAPLAGDDAAQMANWCKAFIAAWKSNFEFAFNGINPPVSIDDQWKIFLQVVRAWNFTHQPGAGYQFDPQYPSYLDRMAGQVVANYPQDAPGGIVTVHTGPEKKVPITTNLAPPIPKPTATAGAAGGKKLLVGTAVVGGAAAGGLALYAGYHGLTMAQAIRHIFGRG